MSYCLYGFVWLTCTLAIVGVDHITCKGGGWPPPMTLVASPRVLPKDTCYLWQSAWKKDILVSNPGVQG